jgi:stage II sporulation protein D
MNLCRLLSIGAHGLHGQDARRDFATPLRQFRWAFAGLFFLPGVCFSLNPVLLEHDASQLLEDGRFLDALSIYEELTDSSLPVPWRARGYLQIGGIRSLFLDDLVGAEAALKEAVRLDPLGPMGARAHFKLGMIYHEQSRYEEAAGEFDRHLELDPGSVNAPTAEFLAGQCRRLIGSLPVVEKPDLEQQSTYKALTTEIRVAVVRDTRSVSIGCKGSWRALRAESDDAVEMSRGDYVVVREGDVLRVTGRDLRSDEFRFVPDGDDPLEVNSVPLVGHVQVCINGQDALAINRVDIEEYLRGVVPKEMPASWSSAALEAQAICARTYAIYQISKRRDYSFDVLSTVESQVYGGESARHPWSDGAVAATRGKILLYDGEPALALFHSSSGGFTEDMEDVWGSGLPYLKATPDPHSPAMDWDLSISLKEIERALERHNVNVGTLKKIRFEDPSESGRFRYIRLEGSTDTALVRSNRFRLCVGSGSMRSTRLRDRWSRGKLVLAGTGFGHGVGMSQWGAKAMAVEGASAEEILKFYYPGTVLGELR